MNRLVFFAFAILLNSCALTGNLGSNYGQIFPVGAKVNCGAFQIISFERNLRSSPNAYGKGTYVGYEDNGPGMDRGTVFIVLPLNVAGKKDVAGTLAATDPKRRGFWSEGRVLSGSIDSGTFVFYVPEDWSGTERMKTINRPALALKGSVVRTQSQAFLVLSQEEESTSIDVTLRILEKKHSRFLRAVQFQS
ncbi:MAG TPA: hypothetical protein VIT23_10860 [Terrimicrobiaceae bacterium]